MQVRILGGVPRASAGGRAPITSHGFLRAENAIAPLGGAHFRYYPRALMTRDDIATVAYWYQTLPLAPYPEFPDRNTREII